MTSFFGPVGVEGLQFLEKADKYNQQNIGQDIITVIHHTLVPQCFSILRKKVVLAIY